jgi:hypothetical protein
VETRRVEVVAENRVFGEKPADLRVVESRPGIDEARRLVMLMAGEAKGVGAGAGGGSEVAPGVPLVAGQI